MLVLSAIGALPDLPRPASRLDALPAEVQDMVLDHLPDEDDLGRMAETSRYWRGLTDARMPAHGNDARSAFDHGHRHALARALGTPKDVSHFATGLRDSQDMTFMMHAARKADRAMVRCLVRNGATDLQQTDIAHLTARDWALLHNGVYAFDQDVEQASGQRLGPHNVHYGNHNLHRAISMGHGQLVACLLHGYYRADNPWQNPYLCRDDVQEMPLSCGLGVVACAIRHAPPQRPVLDVVLATQQ